MNKTYIIIAILVIIASGFFLVVKNRQVEAPVRVEDINGINSADDSVSNNTSGSGTVTVPQSNVADLGGVMCAEDAQLCSDGSYVVRKGPSCEFAACPNIKADKAVKEFIVLGKNFSFTPSIIEVKKGDKVKVVFKNTSGFHDFVIDEYSIKSKQTKSPSEEVLEFTADKIGSFEYYCSVGTHRSMGMKGTLKVTQ